MADHSPSTADLLRLKPAAVSREALDRLAEGFTSVVQHAQVCEISEMVQDLMAVDRGLAGIWTELEEGFKAGGLTKDEYYSYVHELSLFEHGTIPNTVTQWLATNCKCRVEQPVAPLPMGRAERDRKEDAGG